MKRVTRINSICCAIIALCLTSAGKCPYPPIPDVIWEKVDEYGNISFREEKARLDQFILRLRGESRSTAYVIAYAGRVSCAGEARTRANRVKNYLTNVGRIEAKRIQIIDAGCREQWLIDLYTAPPNAPPLTKAVFADYDCHLRPGQVVVLKNCKGRLYGKH
jgi:hypothetical protein